MSFTVKKTNYASGARVETVETLGVEATLTAKMETVQVMSDIWESQLYVTYWDAAAGKPASAYLPDQGLADVTIDYTPQVFKAYLTYMAKLRYETAYEKLLDTVQATNMKAVAGSTVKIVGGRPKPGVVTGQEYKVFHVMDRNYGMGYTSVTRPMLGIALDEEKHDTVGKNGKTYQSYKNVAWVWAHNTEVVGAAEATEKALPMIKAQALQTMETYVSGLITEFNQQKKAA